MADRYQSNDRSRRDRPERGYGRQAEQFQSDYDDDRRSQMGESWRDDDYGAQQSSWQPEDRGDRTGGRYREASSERFGSGGGYGPSRYSPGGGRGFASFTGNDFGGRDFSGGTDSYSQARSTSGERPFGRGTWGAGSDGAGSWLGANHGEWRDRDFSGGRDHRGHDERGFLERAGDAVSRWFGDDDDGTGYRRESYRGHGPAGYTRTDERIREDASERLTDDWAVDARKIEVAVSGGEITLNGTVSNRSQKRRAEDLVEDLSGVKHVQNNLRVEQGSTWDSGESASKTTPSR